MEFPDSYPILTWVIMGGFGVASSIVFSLVLWKWLRSGQLQNKSVPVSNYSILGLCFLFASGLFCCGIAGPPGYALSKDPNLVSHLWIYRASFMSNLFALIGWILYVIGQNKTIKLLSDES